MAGGYFFEWTASAFPLQEATLRQRDAKPQVYICAY